LDIAAAVNLIYIVTKVTIIITSCFIKISLYRFSKDCRDY